MGIIPAHAGNTSLTLSGDSPNGDHPRACGEHSHQAWPTPIDKGSSPRMRGTPYWRVCGLWPRGIIPAHAGNTAGSGTDIWVSQDHPRACGEHVSVLASTHTIGGSSPRMRGTPLQRLQSFLGAGIIPAHAGNTGRYARLSVICQDHPRACGEHLGFYVNALADQGSSPRMRGTPYRGKSSIRYDIIIPAHAGNTNAVWA